MEKWQGKLKAVTFSFDDGVTQDRRLVPLLNKYGLKSTFNLNSALFGTHGELDIFGKITKHDIISPAEVKTLYKGHEIAVHTLSHPNLTGLDEDSIIYQVEKDRLNLSELAGYEVIGMAYPCGGVNNDERVADIIKRRTGVKYSRTITSTYGFGLPENPYRYYPTVPYQEHEKMFELAEKFVDLKSDKPQLFYIWGHSYEMDAELITWERFEEFCKFISNRSDIFYGTNKETLL